MIQLIAAIYEEMILGVSFPLLHDLHLFLDFYFPVRVFLLDRLCELQYLMMCHPHSHYYSSFP